MAFLDEFGLLRVLVVVLPGSFCSQNCPFRITVEFGGLLVINCIHNLQISSKPRSLPAYHSVFAAKIDFGGEPGSQSQGTMVGS